MFESLLWTLDPDHPRRRAERVYLYLGALLRASWLHKNKTAENKEKQHFLLTLKFTLETTQKATAA